MRRIKYRGATYVMAEEKVSFADVYYPIDRNFKAHRMKVLMNNAVDRQQLTKDQFERFLEKALSDPQIQAMANGLVKLEQYENWMYKAKDYLPKLQQWAKDHTKPIANKLTQLVNESKRAPQEAVEVSRDALSKEMRSYLDMRMTNSKLQPGTPKYKQLEQRIIKQMLADEENPPDPSKVMMRHYSVKYRDALYVPVDVPEELVFQGSKYTLAADPKDAEANAKKEKLDEIFQSIASAREEGLSVMKFAIEGLEELGLNKLAGELEELKTHLDTAGQQKLTYFQRKAEDQLAKELEGKAD